MPNLIRDIYDIPALSAQHEEFIGLLKQSKEAIIDLNNQRVTAKSSTMSEFTAATEALNKTMNESTAITNQATAAKNNLVKATADNLKIQQQQIKTETETIRLMREEEKLTQDQIKTQKILSSEKEKAQKIAAGDAKLIDQAVNEYMQLNKALADAELKYKNLALTQGFSNKQTQEALKSALAIRGVLNKVDQSLQNYQRNVGNYGSAYNGLGMSIQQILREAPSAAVSLNTFFLAISNNLPIFFDQVTQLQKAQKAAEATSKLAAATAKEEAVAQSLAAGATQKAALAEGELAAATVLANSATTKAPSILSQIGKSLLSVNTFLTLGVLALTLFGGKIVEWVGSLFKGKAALDDLKINLKNVNDVVAEANKTAGEQITTLKLLRATAQDLTASTKERKAAVDELQKQFPETYKNMSDEIILAGKDSAAYDELTTSIINAARARAAKGKLDAIETKRLDNDFAKKKLRDEADLRRENIKGDKQEILPGTISYGDNIVLTKTPVQQVRAIQKELSKSLDPLLKLDASFDREEAFLTQFVGGAKVIAKVIEEDDKKKGEKAKKVALDHLSKLKQDLDTEFDTYRVAQEAKMRLFEADMASDKVYYLDKLVALENYTKAKKELLDREEAEAIRHAKEAAESEVQSLTKSKVGKSKQEQARINENITITEDNLRKQILLIQTVYADKSIELVETSGRRREQIIDAQHATELKNYQDFKKEMEAEEKKDDDRIKEGFRKRAEQEKEFANMRKQLEKEVQNSKIELAKQGEDFLYNLATSSLERQLNIIQEQKNLVDERKASDLANNDAIVQSAQDREANIIAINTRAQIQKEALDRKAAEIEYRKAQFARAQQLFEIGIQTIKSLAAIRLKIAEIRAAAALNPLLNALIPIAASQIPLVIASSALAIGALFAKPLPKYKRGRGEGREETAIVGDGGKSEYIVREDGSIERTPAVETITHLMPKDVVYSSKEILMQNLLASSAPKSVGGSAVGKQEMERFTTRLEDAVGNIQINTQLITKDGWRQHNKNLSDYDNWVNRVVKGV